MLMRMGGRPSPQTLGAESHEPQDHHCLAIVRYPAADRDASGPQRGIQGRSCDPVQLFRQRLERRWAERLPARQPVDAEQRIGARRQNAGPGPRGPAARAAGTRQRETRHGRLAADHARGASDGPVRYSVTYWATPLPDVRNWQKAFDWPTEGENYLNWILVQATNTSDQPAEANAEVQPACPSALRWKARRKRRPRGDTAPAPLVLETRPRPVRGGRGPLHVLPHR